MRVLRKIAAAVVVAVMVAGWAGPAGAVPLEHLHESETATEFDDAFCGDLDVRIDVDFSGHVLIVLRKGLPYFQANVRVTTVITNLANGKTFTLVDTVLDKDAQIVDNGDGTFTITVRIAGSTHVFGPDGKRLFLDTGLTLFQILIDNGGTPSDPSDDEFIADLDVLKRVGRNDTATRDFCEDIHTFIG